MKALSLISIFLFLVGCGQPQGETTAKISLAAITGSANYPGGLVFYAENEVLGKEIFKMVPDTDTIELILPNGNWNFAVIGWSGGAQSKVFEGEVKCGEVKNASLTGADFQVGIQLTNAACESIGGDQTNSDGTTSDGIGYDPVTKKFSRLAFGSCIGAKDYLDRGKGPEIPTEIGCGGPSPFLKGAARRFKVFMPQLALDGTISPGLETECRSLDDSYRNYTDINLPISLPHTLEYIVATYSDVNCANEVGRSRFMELSDRSTDYLNRGIVISQTADGYPSVAPYHTQGEARTVIIINEEACTPDQLDNLPFALGDTGANNGKGAYLICTPAQFQNIAAATCPAMSGGVEDISPGMDCESNGQYIIGQDIDFGGSNTPIANTFNGELRGQFNALKNLGNPLFSSIGVLAASDRVDITDLVISDSTITDNTGTPIGLLARTIVSSGLQGEIEIRDTQLLNSSITDTSNGTNYIGALVGRIDFVSTAPNNSENLDIRKIYSNVDLSNSGTGGKSIGGLVGSAERTSSNGRVSFERNVVGMTPNVDLSQVADVNESLFDFSDFSESITINSSTNANGFISGLGGIVGQAQNIEVRYGNLVHANFSTNTATGGIIGRVLTDLSGNGLKVSNTYSQTTVTPLVAMNDARIGIGGVIGVYDDTANAENIRIEGAISKIYVSEETSPTTFDIFGLGGVIGRYRADGSLNLFIKNTKAAIESFAEGSLHGGFIGEIFFNATGTAESFTGEMNIDRSVAYARLKDEVAAGTSAATVSIYRGGAVGQGSYVKMNMSVVNLEAEAHRFTGAIFGSVNNSVINEVTAYASININNGYVGGAFGEVTSIDGMTVSNLDIETIINYPNITFSGCTTNYCGSVVGHTQGTDGTTWANNILARALIDGSTPAPACDSTTLCVAAAEITGLSSNDVDCTGLSGAFTAETDTGTGKCELTFWDRWREAGGKRDDLGNYINDSTGKRMLLAGSIIEPFEIRDESEWNAIQDDLFLMGKSFEVVNDLDFNFGAITFNPIGTNSFGGSPPNDGGYNPFSGTIFGAGIIRNVYYQTPTSAVGDYDGLINSLFNGQVGLRNYPLRFENIDLECRSSGSCGLVGGANSSGIFAEVIGADYSTATNNPSNYGGLAGQIFNDMEVDSSLFQGQIISSGANVGGFFGQLGGGSSTSLRMEKSAIIVDQLAGTGSVGGVYGSGTSIGGTSYIDNSYVWIDPFDTYTGNRLQGATNQVGAFGGPTSSVAMEIKNSYAFYANAEVLANMRTVAVYSSGTSSASNVYTVGTTGTNDGTFSHTGQYATCADLTASGNFGDKWITDPDTGCPIHEWEVYGHEN